MITGEINHRFQSNEPTTSWPFNFNDCEYNQMLYVNWIHLGSKHVDLNYQCQDERVSVSGSSITDESNGKTKRNECEHTDHQAQQIITNHLPQILL